MNIKKRYIIFVVGLSFFLLSFLWVAINIGVYLFFLIAGIFISTMFYFYILNRKDTLRNKLICTGLILCTILINNITRIQFIDWSFLIYTSYNQDHLNRANLIIQNKTDLYIFNVDEVIEESDQFNDSDIELKKLMEDIGVKYIIKGNNSIYYGLYGFLDDRIGINYIFGDVIKEKSGRPLRKIKDSWYY
jgi:hypothetical protein